MPAWTLGQGGPSPGLPHSFLWAAGPGVCSLPGNVFISADGLHGVRILECIRQDACWWESHSPISRSCSVFKGVCTLVRGSLPPVTISATALYNVMDDCLLWVLFVSFQTKTPWGQGSVGRTLLCVNPQQPGPAGSVLAEHGLEISLPGRLKSPSAAFVSVLKGRLCWATLGYKNSSPLHVCSGAHVNCFVCVCVYTEDSIWNANCCFFHQQFLFSVTFPGSDGWVFIALRNGTNSWLLTFTKKIILFCWV